MSAIAARCCHVAARFKYQVSTANIKGNGGKKKLCQIGQIASMGFISYDVNERVEFPGLTSLGCFDFMSVALSASCGTSFMWHMSKYLSHSTIAL